MKLRIVNLVLGLCVAFTTFSITACNDDGSGVQNPADFNIEVPQKVKDLEGKGFEYDPSPDTHQYAHKQFTNWYEALEKKTVPFGFYKFERFSDEDVKKFVEKLRTDFVGAGYQTTEENNNGVSYSREEGDFIYELTLRGIEPGREFKRRQGGISFIRRNNGKGEVASNGKNVTQEMLYGKVKQFFEKYKEYLGDPNGFGIAESSFIEDENGTDSVISSYDFIVLPVVNGLVMDERHGKQTWISLHFDRNGDLYDFDLFPAKIVPAPEKGMHEIITPDEAFNTIVEQSGISQNLDKYNIKKGFFYDSAISPDKKRYFVPIYSYIFMPIEKNQNLMPVIGGVPAFKDKSIIEGYVIRSVMHP